MNDSIKRFLASDSFAVAGASNNRNKFGNRVFRALLDSGRSVFPINPAAAEIEGETAFASVGDLPSAPQAISIITPPKVTRDVVAAAIAAGVRHIWMQPGAQDPLASKQARAAGINVIDDGSCILVVLAQEK